MFITFDHLERAKPNIIQKGFYLNESLNKRFRAKYTHEVSVFLSHKNSDTKYVDNAIAILSNAGVETYIDPQEISIVDAKTAIRIKEKIETNKKFILLASPDAINSKWCNWELGIGDVKKYPMNIALMPISNSTASWPGAEYLQIYPYITTNNEYQYDSYSVEFQNKKESLGQWLRS